MWIFIVCSYLKDTFFSCRGSNPYPIVWLRWLIWSRGYKHFFMLNLLSMKFVMLINLKYQTIAKSLLLNVAEHNIFSANKYENANYCWHFHIY